MRFTVLIHSNPDVVALFAGMTDPERLAAYQIYWDVESDLKASGELIDSAAIHEEGQRFVQLGVDGAPSVTDAPGPGDGDVVSGYYRIDVADEARAIEIAARFPEARVAGGIRVARNYTDEDFAALG